MGAINRGGTSLVGSAGGRRSAPKVTQNPSLPRVVGSPVKGRGPTVAKSSSISVPPPTRPLTILKGCIVYVDLISGFGDDSAKSFITDMLKDLGTRVLGSVGRTLTHIVYKNGLGGTLSRYRRLPDPKPLVVGIEWVIQSAKKGTHEDETPYIIDANDMNTTAMKVFCFVPAH
ncbi:hypothetical protein B0H13DRAFT_1603491 [Mycena leptocephala]|nr:hypothetical protein B0H13DRAFT_1603491 [Mycena leptocephala]